VQCRLDGEALIIRQRSAGWHAGSDVGCCPVADTEGIVTRPMIDVSGRAFVDLAADVTMALARD
jgi:hypothetical protein